MTDNNTIDIGDRLPIEVRKPWRRRLSYARHIDDLLAIQKEMRELQSRLRNIDRDMVEVKWRGGGTPSDTREPRKWIADALVLLGCAEEKLVSSVPTEEYMPAESLREFQRLGLIDAE